MAQWRRLEDLLLELNFLDMQLQVLLEAGGPHKPRGVAMRRAKLQRRFSAVEAQVRQLARALGEPDDQPLSRLRQRLAAFVQANENHSGPEWRAFPKPPTRTG